MEARGDSEGEEDLEASPLTLSEIPKLPMGIKRSRSLSFSLLLLPIRDLSLSLSLSFFIFYFFWVLSLISSFLPSRLAKAKSKCVTNSLYLLPGAGAGAGAGDSEINGTLKLTN